MNGKNFQEALAEAEVCGVQATGGLQVISIRWIVSEDLEYLTLDEALGKDVLEVTEVDEGGRVPTIRVANRSDHPVFMMAGELLTGCKQDRVLNTSIVVPAHQEIQIPVTCVEAGRWGYRSRKFGSAKSSSHSMLRMMMSKQATSSYRNVGEARPSQSCVWEEVERKLTALDSRSGTSALHDVFTDYAERLERYLERMTAPRGSNGIVVVIDGRIVGADMFDKASTLAKLWAKLLRSYAIDALEATSIGKEQLKAEAVSEWLRKKPVLPRPSPMTRRALDVIFGSRAIRCTAQPWSSRAGHFTGNCSANQPDRGIGSRCDKKLSQTRLATKNELGTLAAFTSPIEHFRSGTALLLDVGKRIARCYRVDRRALGLGASL